MTTKLLGHPTDDQIRSFADGLTDEAETSRMLEHLESCEECGRKLERLADRPADTLEQRLRGLHSVDLPVSVPDPSVITRALADETTGPRVPPRSTLTDPSGTWIGPYRVVSKLGEGGMGAVYLAEQETPVRRRVALKLIKPGMDSAQVVARFEAERQALALMDHPNIARVYEAGTTRDGRPYFVMELVDGIPFTDYCESSGLDLRERIALLIDVCDAIQHAHQKGVIHRDIKPSNVLVSGGGSRPIVKVIDFGVAKSVDDPSGSRTGFTVQGWFVGTPEYMSPEQVGATPGGVDTRTDIYALGVLLYEVLTGGTPLERSWIRNATHIEILQRIGEEEPARPSARIAAQAASTKRSTDLNKLARSVRGDLDRVIMKALEKDRTLRYQSAADLARDLERYLAGDPVDAHEPTWAYRMRKTARKHRLALGTATAFLLLLVAAAITGATLAVQANRAKRLADQRRVVAENALRDSERSRAQTESIKAFLIEAIRQADPDNQAGEPRLSHVIDWEVENLQSRFSGSPVIRGELLHVAGETYLNLSQLDKAENAFRTAVKVREESLGTEHIDTLRSRIKLAQVVLTAGRIDEVVDLARENLDKITRLAGPDHPDTLATRLIFGMIQLPRNDPESLIPFARETIERCSQVLGTRHPDTHRAMSLLGLACWQGSRTMESIRWLEESIRGFESIGKGQSADAFKARNNLGLSYLGINRTREAVRMFEGTLAWAERALGAEHIDTLSFRNNLALAYARSGRPDQAEKVGRVGLELLVKSLGSDHRLTRITQENIEAWHASAQGMADAERAFHEATAGRAPDDPAALDARLEWARMLNLVYAFERAEVPAREVLETRLRRLGPSHPDTLEAWNVLAFAQQRSPHGQGQAEYRVLLETARRSLGADHPTTRRIAMDCLRTLNANARFRPDLVIACAEVLGCHDLLLELVRTPFD